MTFLRSARWAPILVALVAAAHLVRPAPAQQMSPQAAAAYKAAVQAQNSGLYDQAIDLWKEFIDKYPENPWVGKATHYLGVCYFQNGKLDEALATFQKVVADHPKLDLLESTYLYLGVTQYSLAQGGKKELYPKAAETFNTLVTKWPEGKYVADGLFYRGECFYMQGNREEAVKMYGRMTGKYPEHRFVADALYAMGVAQEELGQNDAAGKTYDQFLEKFPDHRLATEVGMRRGETLLAGGNFAEAAKRFAAAAAAENFPLADYATLRQADALAQLKKFAEAADLYAAVGQKFPKSEHAGRAALAGGKCYYLAGKMTEARGLLTKILDGGGPSAPEAAHWIAKSLLKEKKPADALAAVEKVLPAEGNPFAPQLLMDQADAVYDIPQRRGESVALYAAIAEKHPGDAVAPQALYMAGFAALELGQYQEALKHAEAFLPKNPDHELAPDVGHVAAESQLLLKQYPEAEARYAALIEKYPKHADAALWKVRRGLALQLQNKYQETVDALSPAVEGIKPPALAAEARYLIGLSQLELGQDQPAVGSLEASLAADPKWRQADETRLALARAYRDLNKVDQAKAAVEKLIADFPKSQVLDKAYYRLGEYSYLQGNYKAAAEAYQKVVDGFGNSPLVPHALHELGCAQLNEKDAAAAEATLTTLVDKYPKHELVPRARYARGMARHQQKEYGPAVEDLQAMLAAGGAGTEKADARYVLGLCQMGLDKNAEAAATFQTLLQEDPDYSGADNARYQLAWALKLQGKEKEAADQFAKLAEQFPDSERTAEALYHVGELAYKNKDYGEASKAYYDSMNKAGKNDLGEKAAHKLAWSYYHENKFDSAQKTFRYQLATYPDGPLASDGGFMEGECLFKEDKFDEALAAYEKVGPVENKDFEVLRLLHAGQAASQLDEWQKAFDLLAKCAEEFPDSTYLPDALYEQGWAQQNLGKKDEAMKLYEQVIAKTGREVAARAQFMIGELQFQDKKHNDAVKSYFKVIYGYSFPKWRAEAMYEAGRCFEVLKKPDQALKQYRQLVQEFPEHEKTALAKERIEQLK